MMSNTEIATAFYQAFRRKDITTMQSLYADSVVFNDPVFQNLDARQAKAMWEMLLGRSADMSVDYTVGKEAGNTVTVTWMAIYTFSTTGRRVINHVEATLTIENGKIVKHTDQFPFAKWARQALGFKGVLLGHTSFLKRKIRATAMENLARFMAKSK